MSYRSPASIVTTANFAHRRATADFAFQTNTPRKIPRTSRPWARGNESSCATPGCWIPRRRSPATAFNWRAPPTALDLLDNDVVRAEFYAECRRLLARVTGCVDVRGGNHEYRNGFGGESGARGARPTPNGSGGAYAQGIHADMCAAVEQRFARIVPDERHFESINIWRSAIPETIETMPLAVCAMPSVRPDDIVFGDGQNTGNIKQYTKVVDQRLIHGPHQRWWCFPRMTPDEVLLFRQYDTRQDALNMRTVFHTAVADPNTPPDAPMRYTIEVRMQAVYGRETAKAERVARFLAEIPPNYADGRRCDWWSGPIEGYAPPPGAG